MIFVVNYYSRVQSRNVKITFVLLRLFERRVRMGGWKGWENEGDWGNLGDLGGLGGLGRLGRLGRLGGLGDLGHLEDLGNFRGLGRRHFDFKKRGLFYFRRLYIF